MQETFDNDGVNHQEKFYADSHMELMGQMNDRMMELESRGHTLKQRTFSQVPQNNSQRRREKRKAQKRARRANRG